MAWKLSVFIASTILTVQPVSAQQVEPDFRMIAQAVDRCMATYAVRLTKTAAADEEIYRSASAGCAPLQARLSAAIQAQLPSAEAATLLRAIDDQAKPSFLNMVTKIRSDRAARAGG